MTDARSPMRAFRAALFAAVCITLAAMGHSSMSASAMSASAHDIPFPALLAAFGVTAAAGWLAAGRRRGVPAFGAGLLAVQGALHLIFSGAGGQPAPHHQPHESAAMDTDAGMLAAHLLAAAVCALWLARGETAFFRLAHAVGTLAFTPLRLLLATVRRLPEARRPVPQSPQFRRLHGVLLVHTLVRRGPPALPAPRATAPGAAV